MNRTKQAVLRRILKRIIDNAEVKMYKKQTNKVYVSGYEVKLIKDEFIPYLGGGGTVKQTFIVRDKKGNVYKVKISFGLWDEDVSNGVIVKSSPEEWEIEEL